MQSGSPIKTSERNHILEVKLVNTGGETKRTQELTLLNDELRRLDLTNPDDLNRKQQIQNNLADNFFLSTISISDENDSSPVKFRYVLGSKILFISISKLDLMNNFWSVVYDKLPFIF